MDHLANTPYPVINNGASCQFLKLLFENSKNELTISDYVSVLSAVTPNSVQPLKAIALNRHLTPVISRKIPEVVDFLKDKNMTEFKWLLNTNIPEIVLSVFDQIQFRSFFCGMSIWTTGINVSDRAENIFTLRQDRLNPDLVIRCFSATCAKRSRYISVIINKGDSNVENMVPQIIGLGDELRIKLVHTEESQTQLTLRFEKVF
ncbi:unnamed protein product [Caenorhabditis sp. 36 PRJEB53466]|nr:unnamed protein product [Caenorhabditis sp. 36 PRJEB53466]